tara:strand:+ start:55 stop:492 length:438 start_codon:yes stop_codon:yes gene_type:complete
MYTKKNGRMTYKSNRRPNFKRNNNFVSKNRNKGNITQQYNKYLKLAKDTFSSGDRIQAEYYYQFTDHYYRLMIELGINLEEQDNADDTKSSNNENANIEEVKEVSGEDNTRLVDHDVKDEDSDASIESVPFISEPVKKKRTRTQK